MIDTLKFLEMFHYLDNVKLREDEFDLVELVKLIAPLHSEEQEAQLVQIYRRYGGGRTVDGVPTLQNILTRAQAIEDVKSFERRQKNWEAS